MRPMLLLLLLAVPPSSSAQAVRPAPTPATGPLIVQEPPSYPVPTYTPPGTGLPATGQPGAQPALVPRSPNKRVLPATKEAGVWAADGAQASSATGVVQLFDVELPLPVGADSELVSTAKQCALEMTLAMRDSAQLHILNYLKDDKACVAARALLYCSTARRKDRERTPSRDATQLRRLEVHMKALVQRLCTGQLPEDQRKTLDRVEKRWETATTQNP